MKAAEGLEMFEALVDENAEVRRALDDDAYRIPRGWYRAHRAITRGTCAHCGIGFHVGDRIGYNSILPGRHKVICRDCFHGLPAVKADPRRETDTGARP